MAGERVPARIESGANRLGNAEDDAARERSPQASQAADDDDFERVEQPRRTDGRIEYGANAEQDAGDRHDRERDGGRQGINVPIVDPVQAGSIGIVRGGAERAAQSGTIQDKLDCADDGHRHHKDGRRHQADGELIANADAAHFQPRQLQAPAIRTEQFQQHVLDDDG